MHASDLTPLTSCLPPIYSCMCAGPKCNQLCQSVQTTRHRVKLTAPGPRVFSYRAFGGPCCGEGLRLLAECLIRPLAPPCPVYSCETVWAGSSTRQKDSIFPLLVGIVPRDRVENGRLFHSPHRHAFTFYCCAPLAAVGLSRSASMPYCVLSANRDAK